MNHTGDPVDNLDHKHFEKVMELANRIEYFKHVGPAMSEDDWDRLEDNYNWVDALVQLMVADDTYKITRKSMKMMNELYKRYEYGNKVSKIKQTADEMLEAIKNIKK
jgi:hypothetical protein